MKTCCRSLGLVIVAGMLCVMASGAEAPPNTLTSAELQQGWRLLWDGKTTEGWRSAANAGFPPDGWVIHEGVWSVSPSGIDGKGHGGEIITTANYSNLETDLEFKMSHGTSSGVKYFVDPVR